MMTDCPCGSQNTYVQCCAPYLTEKKYPLTPEALMRSRYTAYTMANIEYIEKTMCGPALVGFQAANATRWAKQVIWIGLKVLQTGLNNPNKGYVEFKASFMENNVLKLMHEKSEFIREQGRWYYIDDVQF
jgi:SEC-C motif domain protein